MALDLCHNFVLAEYLENEYVYFVRFYLHIYIYWNS